MIFNIDIIKEIYEKNKNKPWLFILVGLPSSGKSTIAEEIKKEINNTTIISSDSIRQELFGENYVRSIKTFETAKQRIYENIDLGKNVIFDATNLNRYKREPIFNNEKRDEYIAVTIYLNENPNDCLKRNNIRTRKQPVPDYEITNNIKKLIPPTNDEDFDFRFNVINNIAYLEI